MKCRFFSDDEEWHGHIVRHLQICCDNGFQGDIFVTQEPPFSIVHQDGHVTNTWHYTVSEDGKRITLTGNGSNSVKFVGLDGTERCHETITDWPLEND